MEVRLKQKWFGYTVGTIVKVNNDCANSLFQMDMAEQMEPESRAAIKEKFQCIMVNKAKILP